MKFVDINRKYTETVAEWISKGYTINTATMSGSQGEIAAIDLTNGVEIIRVLLKGNGRPIVVINDRYYLSTYEMANTFIRTLLGGLK